MNLVTATQWAEQVQSTSDVVAAIFDAVSLAGGAATGTPQRPTPLWRETQTWMRGWEHFAESAQVPPIVPLPPPLPSVFVRSSAWERLISWDKQARALHSRWRRTGLAMGEPPPPADPPLQLSPQALAALGFDVGGGVGIGLAAVAAIALIVALRR